MPLYDARLGVEPLLYCADLLSKKLLILNQKTRAFAGGRTAWYNQLGGDIEMIADPDYTRVNGADRLVFAAHVHTGLHGKLDNRN